MSIGSAVRTLLGPSLARRAGHWYRAVFVDIDIVADCIAQAIPANARVLDVGGGDGIPLNRLLDHRPDITATTIDIAGDVGQWLHSRHASRVVRMSGVTLERYISSMGVAPDVMTLVDVVHHIPVGMRPAFWQTVAELMRRAPKLRLIVKDVEPGHVRATLGYWADKYITGDRTVSPISRATLAADVCTSIAGAQCTHTKLFERDPPNYAMVFTRR